MSYEELLKRAKEGMPTTQTSRFDIPPLEIVTGKTTSLRNFVDIAKIIRRDPKHIAKYLFKQLAIPGDIRGKELILQGKISPGLIEQRFKDYLDIFVFCSECKKPDTIFTKNDNIVTIKCEACGARKTMKA